MLLKGANSITYIAGLCWPSMTYAAEPCQMMHDQAMDKQSSQMAMMDHSSMQMSDSTTSDNSPATPINQ